MVEETVLDQSPTQCVTLDAEQLRGVGLVSFRTFQRLADELALDIHQRDSRWRQLDLQLALLLLIPWSLSWRLLDHDYQTNALG